MDHIDIYRPARLDPKVPIEETVGTIAELIKAGYVRAIGLSEVGPETVRRAQTVHPICDLQIEYSLLSRGPKDRFDNAVTEVMLEGAEKGDDISYQRFLLPLARMVKAYSILLNSFGKAGPIPEGMSATTALRTDYYMNKHRAIGERLAEKAEQFKKEHGYEAPYWRLVSLAREVKKERGGN